jgi:hypothetical protein
MPKNNYPDNKHMEALYTLGPDFSFTKWNELRRIEMTAHRRAEQYCNGEITEEQSDASDKRIEKRIIKVFGKIPDGFFLNGDPRGYALKLDNEKVTIPDGMHKDWGGYGIICPLD